MAHLDSQSEVKFRHSWQRASVSPVTEGDRLRLWRERMGWSRGRLAAMTGYSVASLVEYETGRTPRQAREWRKLRMACLGAWCEANAGRQWEWI